MKRITTLTLFISLAVSSLWSKTETPPNILLILTDDQGLSDLSFYGNPSLETPHLDALANEGLRLENFLASPTCSPTRAALMTGQHEFKVGITHTISGRSLLKPGVPTLPETLKEAGYRTAIFGKWHLGENYPSRPQDRGFDEVFIHLGGGIGQTPDYWGNTYFDPHILHNGTWTQTKGYCSQVFSHAAWNWIEQQGPHPWFAYLSLNAPHTPLQIHEELAQKYLDKGLPESQARFYAMIDDLDREVGELRQKLKDKGLADNTLIIFMGDNGSAKGGKPAELEYNAGLRGTKASPYQGGIQVPCLVYWPQGGFTGGHSIETLASMRDWYPTLTELAGAQFPAHNPIDGQSIVALLRQENTDNWPDRTVITHVGRWPNKADLSKHKYPGSSIRNQRFSLVEGKALYDLNQDRAEKNNVAKQYPEVFSSLKKEYDQWWQAIAPSLTAIAPITIGSPQEPIAHLTCMDWGASYSDPNNKKYPPWHQKYLDTFVVQKKALKTHTLRGAWKVNFVRSGQYKITLRNLAAEAPDPHATIAVGQAELMIGKQRYTQKIASAQTQVDFLVDIPTGVTQLETLITPQHDPSRAHSAFFLSVQHIPTMQ